MNNYNLPLFFASEKKIETDTFLILIFIYNFVIPQKIKIAELKNKNFWQEKAKKRKMFKEHDQDSNF